MVESERVPSDVRSDSLSVEPSLSEDIAELFRACNRKCSKCRELIILKIP